MKPVIYKSIYRLMGIGFIFGSLGTFSLMFGFFPEMAEAVYSHETHIIQEFGCALAFMGLVTIWLSFNLERGKPIHLILTVFFLLQAFVHWVDFFKGNLPMTSPVVNSIPVLALAVMHMFYDFGSNDG